jgi:glyoxylate/hydroxypyruvate reductase A
MAEPGAVLIASGPWDPAPWAAAMRRLAPERAVHVWPDLSDPGAIRYALAWRPPAEALKRLPNLAAIFSLGAGVDGLVERTDLPDVPLVRVVDPDLTERMAEWVVLQVLMHHRRQRTYDRQQAAHRWHELAQPPARAVRVGMLGLGHLGRHAGGILAALGFSVAGWSRTAKAVAGIACFHGPEGLEPFLARTDILVALLPLTPQTRGILDARLIGGLARDGALGGPVLINGGRGGLQVEADVVAALRSGALIGASLDVFEPEPLAAGSPLWDMADVIITPHAAAGSDPETLSRGIHRQMLELEAGMPLRNLVDRRRGY